MEFLHGDAWSVDNIHRTARRFVEAVKAGDGATAHFLQFTHENVNGYVVGGAVPEVVIPVDQFDGREAFYAITRLLKSAEDAGVTIDTLGVWVDGGLAYVDAANICYGIPYSIEVAMERGELAIYDRVNRECITVPQPKRVAA